MEKKYQIFISSTYEDLKEARKKVQDAILSMYHFPVGMELFGAADEEQWQIIRETIDSSDYYVLIIAQRYGSIITEGPDAGISYTEKEFHYAKEKGIPILAFLISDDVPLLPANVEKDNDKVEKLQKFKEEAKKGRTVDWWNNEDDLAAKVTNSLYKSFARDKRCGWIRGDSIDVEKSLQEIITLNNKVRELENENKELRDKMVERKPKLLIGINSEGQWKVEKKDIERPEQVLANYRKLTMNDARVYGVKVTQEQLDEYNNNLPSEALLEQYVDSLWEYIYKTEANVEFEFYIKNAGNCKAKDINVTMEFPEELLVIDKELLEIIREPEAPKKPKNPIQEAFKKTSVGMGLDFLSSMHEIPRIEPTLFAHTLKPANIYYDQKIEHNRIKIEIRELLHTYKYNYDEYCVVPLKRGKFQIKCTLMCEEFLEPVEQMIDIEVV